MFTAFRGVIKSDLGSAFEGVIPPVGCPVERTEVDPAVVEIKGIAPDLLRTKSNDAGVAIALDFQGAVGILGGPLFT